VCEVNCLTGSLSVEDGYERLHHGCSSPGAKSYLSTGSSGMTLADLNNQSRLHVPCRLQLVKPLEGCFDSFQHIVFHWLILTLSADYLSVLTLLVGWQDGHLACKKTKW